MSQSLVGGSGAESVLAPLKLDPVSASTGEILDALVRRYGGREWTRSLAADGVRVRVHFHHANGDTFAGEGDTTREAALRLGARLAAIYPDAQEV